MSSLHVSQNSISYRFGLKTYFMRIHRDGFYSSALLKLTSKLALAYRQADASVQTETCYSRLNVEEPVQLVRFGPCTPLLCVQSAITHLHWSISAPQQPRRLQIAAFTCHSVLYCCDEQLGSVVLSVAAQHLQACVSERVSQPHSADGNVCVYMCVCCWCCCWWCSCSKRSWWGCKLRPSPSVRC